MFPLWVDLLTQFSVPQQSLGSFCLTETWSQWVPRRDSYRFWENTALVSDRCLISMDTLTWEVSHWCDALVKDLLCGLDALVSSPLCQPPCSSNPSTMSRRSESLVEDLVQPSNNRIIVMWIKCGVELKRLQMFFRPAAAHGSSLQRIFAWQTWAKMAAEVVWLSLAAEGFCRDLSSSGSVQKLLCPIKTVDFVTRP